MTHPRTAPAPLAAVAGSLGLCLSAAVLAGAPAPTAPSAAQSGPAAAPADGSADGSASPTVEAAPADRSESGGEDGGASPWAWALDALGLLAVAGGATVEQARAEQHGPVAE